MFFKVIFWFGIPLTILSVIIGLFVSLSILFLIAGFSWPSAPVFIHGLVSCIFIFIVMIWIFWARRKKAL